MRRKGGFLALVIVLLVAATGAEQALAQSDDHTVLIHQVGQLYRAGRYGEAIPIAQRSLELATRLHGPQHPTVGTSLNELGLLHYALGRHAEAEPLLIRSLAIREKALGANHATVGTSLGNLATLHYAQGRYGEAEPLFMRSLSIMEKTRGSDDPEIARALNNLAALYVLQGRYSEAEPLHRRSLTIREKALGRDHRDVGTSLNNLAQLYEKRGRYTEAEPLYRRAISIVEREVGPHHPQVGIMLNNLAALYGYQGRYKEAEPLHKRSLSIRERALGPHHPDVATALGNLALIYQSLGQYSEAEPLFERSLAIREKALGPGHPSVSISLSNLALFHLAQSRYADAERLLNRSVATKEEAFGADHPNTANVLSSLAGVYEAQGRYAEAETLYNRSLAICEKALGPHHPNVGNVLANLATLYERQGRYREAEPLFNRSLAIREKALGPAHPSVGLSLNNLAGLYLSQGRYAEAEPLLRRDLDIAEKALGLDHPSVGISLNNLAELYREQGRYKEAEPLYKRSLDIKEAAFGVDHPSVGKSAGNLAGLLVAMGLFSEAEPLRLRETRIIQKAFGPDHPNVGTSLNNLAVLYERQGRHSDAEALHKRSLTIRERALGSGHPDVAQSLNNLGVFYELQGRYAEAEALHKRSLSIWESALGPDHPAISTSFNNLAALYYAQERWQFAADYWRMSTSVIVRRSSRSTNALNLLAISKAKSEAAREGFRFESLIKAVYRLREPPALFQLARETFLAAQWAHDSEAAASLAQMAVRSAKGSTQLAALVRERQDLVGEWQAKEKLLIAAKSEPPSTRKANAESALADRLKAIDTRLAAIDWRFSQSFPDYRALASPAPVSVEDVQAQLGPDEALVLFLDTPEVKPLPEETYIWVLTQTDLRWVRSELGTNALAREVSALRCGLDATAWEGGGRDVCSKNLGVPIVNPLPFDHARAHKLYAALFGEVQDLIKGKHLLIVPSGPLTQLPYHVLVTSPPTSSDHRSAAWLAREHAITVLPAVSSLSALRRIGRPSSAPRPMIGFGNPLLDGPDARYASLAQVAREKRRCPERPPQRLVARNNHRVVPLLIETRDGLANVSVIKEQVPLPETADELCAVARDVKAEAARDILLGAKATEHEVKRFSASGELAKYRLVHFATHGVLGGKLDGTHEPGLILTPPSKATEQDDGYLSASEIANLKLDADWVILSACNTAAGATTSAEALSGLARAFIYAQARALLVSHWEVYSHATVKLITVALREMARDAKVGRAEALRRSMLALMDKGEQHESHPAHWAPFVVVGEGGAGR